VLQDRTGAHLLTDFEHGNNDGNQSNPTLAVSLNDNNYVSEVKDKKTVKKK
jgi:hypothetical protein